MSPRRPLWLPTPSLRIIKEEKSPKPPSPALFLSLLFSDLLVKHFVPTRLAFFLDSFPEVRSTRKQGRVTKPCGQITISTVAIITHLSPQTSLSRPGRPRRPSGLSLRTSLRSLEFRIHATASYGLACPLSVIVGLIRWRRFYRQVVPRCPRALVRCTNAPCSGWPFTTHEWEFGVRPVQGHRK